MANEHRNYNNKINDMSFIFFKCSSLKLIPDISTWNINNVENMRDMFSDCISLSFLPDLSKWKTKIDTTNCISLLSIPDFIKKY